MIIHKLDVAKYMRSAKHLKKQNLAVALQNYTKISFKRLYKNLSYLFFTNFCAIFCKIFFLDIQQTFFHNI